MNDQIIQDQSYHLPKYSQAELDAATRTARELAIKEREGCVPEEKALCQLSDPEEYFSDKGHNSCRNQTLQAIRQMYE